MKAGREADEAAMLPLMALSTEAADCLVRMLLVPIVRVQLIGRRS